MGPEASTIFKTFELTEQDRKDYETVLLKFNKHFIPQHNIIHVPAQFHKRDQRVEETIE